MSYILVTDLGLQAIVNAEAGGFLINLATFAVTEAPDPEIAIEDTALIGTPVYSAEIESIEAVGGSTVRVACLLPVKFPESGTWNLTEIGLFLSTGELFAHGKFKVVQEKTNEFAVKIYVYVTAARLLETLNLTVGNSVSLPSTPHVRTLLPPREALNNVILVLDEMEDPDGTTGSLAVKYGNGNNQWGFLGYHREYYGSADLINSTSSFVLAIETQGGFWLNNNEIVIVQAVQGPGAGQSRKAQYNKATDTFTVLEKPFTSLTLDTKICIWRDLKHTLPERKSDIPEYYALHVGVNTFSKTTSAPNTGSMDPGRFSVVLAIDNNTVSLATLPADALVNEEQLSVYVDGVLADPSTYIIGGSNLIFDDVQVAGTRVTVLYFTFVANSGSTVYFYEDVVDVDVDGSKGEFNLPIVPDNTAHLWVFLDGALVDVSEYTLTGARLEFNVTPIGRLVLVSFANYFEVGMRSTIAKSTGMTTGAIEYALPSIVTHVKSTLVIIDGKYVEKEKYSLNTEGSKIIFKENPEANLNIVITTFASTNELTITNKTGTNTGPIWADPAGASGIPNRLEPKLYQFTSNGVGKTFPVGVIPSKEYALVFIDGVFQRLDQYEYLGGNIVLNQAVTSGYLIDIFAINEVKDEGQALTCTTYQFVSSTNLSYNIGSTSDLDGLLIFIDGVYQHRSTYTVTGTTLTFTEITAGKNVEVWRMESNPAPGMVNKVYRVSTNLNNGIAVYTIKEAVAIDVIISGITSNNVMLFAGSVYQHKTEYTIEPNGGLTSIIANIPNVVLTKPVPLDAFIVVSGPPKTRLITRDEFKDTLGDLSVPIGVYKQSHSTIMSLVGVNVFTNIISVNFSTGDTGGYVNIKASLPVRHNNADSAAYYELVLVETNEVLDTDVTEGIAGVSVGQKAVLSWSGYLPLNGSYSVVVRAKNSTNSPNQDVKINAIQEGGSEISSTYARSKIEVIVHN